MQRSSPASLASSVSLIVLLSGASLGLGACNAGPPPKMVASKSDDGVPANSASEERLAAERKPKTSAALPAEETAQPYTTPVNGDGAGTTGAGAAGASGTAARGGGKAGKGPGSKDPTAAKEPKGASGKVSKAECKRLFDRYIDLTVGSDTRFEGIPPEMIAQLKESALSQAQAQKGDPCSTQEVSRTQYTCAISASSTAAWQRCMK